MKEYLKPIITLIKFDEKDVLVGSASAFEVDWLNLPIPDTSSLN